MPNPPSHQRPRTGSFSDTHGIQLHFGEEAARKGREAPRADVQVRPLPTDRELVLRTPDGGEPEERAGGGSGEDARLLATASGRQRAEALGGVDVARERVGGVDERDARTRAARPDPGEGLAEAEDEPRAVQGGIAAKRQQGEGSGGGVEGDDTIPQESAGGEIVRRGELHAECEGPGASSIQRKQWQQVHRSSAKKSARYARLWQVMWVLFGSIFMFCNFYRLDLHNKTHVALPNLLSNICNIRD